ncbi:MAG TPA: glycoside hydrolase family 9 protein [Prolixibacteraceae bacterium]|nr:glycoside hydrolase family 9 protein [Prolixibacteraceae bacterium]
MKIRILFTLLSFAFIAKSQEPMKIAVQNSASYRWLNKEVKENRLLDNMETLGHWEPFTVGAIAVVDARVKAKIEESKRQVTRMSYSRDQSHSGERSLLMKLPTKMEGPGPQSGRGWGRAGVIRNFENEDLSKFNRISIWIYPDCPGYYQDWLEMRLFNEGSEKLPGLFAQEGENTVLLRNREWNHVVWEIGNVARDKISKLEISSWMPGSEPEATDSVAYYLDDLRLEKVEPDYIEGWEVWPGRISFSHTGYQAGALKSAVANNLTANDFSLIDQESGKTVITKPIQKVTTHLGTFQVLDFSEIQKNGSYVLKAGETVTQPFKIDPNTWEATIWKVLNFYYSERCGTPIPGVHGSCHRDWTCIHGDKSIVINGGWHDAGDFTQGLGNTGDAVFALFSLAEKMHARGDNPKLYERLVEEAQWGLDWILKTSFGDGFRNEGSINSRRTNGIIGDYDDITSTARNSPRTNLVAAASEAIAYRVLKERDKRLAAYSLKMAKADWQFAIDKLNLKEEPSSKDIFTGSFDSGNVVHELASAGILASVELWRAAGEARYKAKAIELATIILESQQRKLPDWDIPITGFFYTSPTKEHILHYCHRGHEQEPIVALTQLCEAFPDHPDWMKWYSAVTLHSEYLKTIAKYTEPYGVLPASIYTDQEYLQVPDSRQESFRKQVLNGIPLGRGHYLRLFPVWMDYRGHFGTILPKALALNNAARLRGDLESAKLAQHQLEWVIGRNPFSQSTMYGEGYDFSPLYTPSSGDIVGALPVGIQTRGDSDVPYWPVQSTWTYKEVWTHPVTQWIWLMRDLEGPALVKGKADSNVEFKNLTFGQITVVEPDKQGLISVSLPEGKYVVKSGDVEQAVSLLPAGSYQMDLRKEEAFSFEVAKQTSGNGAVTITLKVQGNGSHQFTVRSNNLIIKDLTKNTVLQPGVKVTLKWQGKITTTDEPWVAVVVPDNDLAHKKELTGSVWER